MHGYNMYVSNVEGNRNVNLWFDYYVLVLSVNRNQLKYLIAKSYEYFNK